MTEQLDVSYLGQVASRILEEMENGQEFMVSDVYNQVRQAYNRFPEDPVIRSFAFTIERIAEKSQPGATITQAKMSEIYNNFAMAQQESKFRIALGHLLGNTNEPKTSQSESFVQKNRVDADSSGIKNQDLADQKLVQSLEAAFGGSLDSLKAFDEKQAQKGAEYVEIELQALGHKDPKVNFMGGNNNTLVYSASFNTNKGLVSIAIPIELNNGKLLLPSTFVADDKLAELTSTNLSYFIDKKAFLSDFTTPDVKTVLKAVGIITGNSSTYASEEFDAELGSLFKNHEEKDMALDTASLYIDRNYEDPKPYIDTTPEVEMPKELAHLASDFENDVLEAVSAFGRDVINNSKKLIASELNSFGFTNTQVKYGSENDSTVVFLAKIGTRKGPVEIEVPLEMARLANGKVAPLAPATFSYGNSSINFGANELRNFAASVSKINTIDDSKFKFMTLPELKSLIIEAADSGDFQTCESVLKHVESRFNEEDHINCLADYQNALIVKAQHGEELNKTASVTESLSTIPAGKGSIYPRLPNGRAIKDVQKTENGFVTQRSLESERLSPLEEGGAAISTSKIILT